MRRLLLIPAFALLLVGAPVLALQQPPRGGDQTTVHDVPVPEAQQRTVQPGFEGEVAVDASLVGITWKGDADASFSVEARDPSGNWSPATSLGGDDTAPDPGTAEGKAVAAHPEQATEPVWVKDANAIRVTLEHGQARDVAVSAVSTDAATAPSGSAGALATLVPVDGPGRFGFAIALLLAGAVLTMFAFGFSMRRGARRRVGVALLVLAAVAVVGCRPAPPSSAPPPAPTPTPTSAPPGPDPTCGSTPTIAPQLKFAVVHHTVNSNSYAPSESAQIVRNIQAYHMNTLHYCDIAYSFLIDQYGQIFEGRQGGVDQAVVGAHTGGFNTGSTGVAIIGDFTSVMPGSSPRNALQQLLSWKLSVHGVDPRTATSTTSGGAGSRWPAGTTVYMEDRIWMHRELWPTACPGDTFAAWIGPHPHADPAHDDPSGGQRLLDNVANTPPSKPTIIPRSSWGAAPFGG